MWISYVDETWKFNVIYGLHNHVLDDKLIGHPIACPKTTDLKLTSKSVKTKGVPKKIKLTQSDNSTRQSLSYFEHVDSHFSDSLIPEFQKSVLKGVHISKPSPTPPLPKIKFIEDMLLFMQNYIERIINVESDDNFGFRTVSSLLGKEDEDHQFVCRHLIQEMMTHMESYTKL